MSIEMTDKRPLKIYKAETIPLYIPIEVIICASVEECSNGSDFEERLAEDMHVKCTECQKDLLSRDGHIYIPKGAQPMCVECFASTLERQKSQ